MKRKSNASYLIAAVLAWLLSSCALGCLVSGFDLNVTGMGRLILLCGLLSLVCAGALRFKYGWLALLCGAALVLGFAWRDGEIIEQTKSLLLNITTRYRSAYGWPVLCPDARNGMFGLVELPLIAMGALIAFVTCWTVCRRRHMIYLLLTAVPALMVCLVVTDTVPDAAYLYGLLLGIGLLLLTDWVRRRAPGQSVSLTFLAAIPLALALGALFLLMPQESYVNQAEEMQEKLLAWFSELQDAAEDTVEQVSANVDTSAGERIALDSLGPRRQWAVPVMDVTAPISGTMYLRGQDYTTYSGTGWIASRLRNEVFGAGGEALGTLEIETRGVRSVLYTPYYPAEDITMVGGKQDNEDRLRSYGYTLTAVPEAAQPDEEGISNLMIDASTLSRQPDAQYRQLPSDTLLWAKELVNQLPDGDIVEEIAYYVRNSARYDLSTARMSRDEDDFARWFLEESDTGYCVHFATAATVLLRAAGIPARYVEGYMFQCTAGEEVTVTEKNAHAWAEYYSAGVWKVLEATPADLSGDEETVSETESTRGTTPEDRPTEEKEPEPTRDGTNLPIPTTGSDLDQPARKEPFKLPGWLKTALWLILAAAAVYAQSELRRRMLEKNWNRGRPNERALRRWTQVRALSRLVKLPIPEELEALAQKAKFSQHTLTAEELARFDAFRKTVRQAIAAMDPLKRWAIRLLFAVD